MRSARLKASEGFTLLELIFTCAVISLLAAIAVPTIFRSRNAANESAAIGTIRTIHTAELTFTLTCGYGLYAPTFPSLADPGGDGFLPEDLTASAMPEKSGYVYDLQPGPSGPSGLADCRGNPTSTEYYVSTVPLAVGNTGFRGFASNQNSVIWQDTSGVAPVEPFDPVGTVTAIE
jgi:prepilin-type N-terminal cleavage/methylation domain-containing protein